MHQAVLDTLGCRANRRSEVKQGIMVYLALQKLCFNRKWLCNVCFLHFDQDQLALIKDIETRTAEYMKLLKPIPVLDSEGKPIENVEETNVENDSTPAYAKLSHPVVQQCEADGYAVVRIDVNNMPPALVPEGTKPPPAAEKEPEKGKTPRTARTDKSAESKATDLEITVPEPDPIDPTKAVIEEIYEKYVLFSLVTLCLHGYFGFHFNFDVVN